MTPAESERVERQIEERSSSHLENWENGDEVSRRQSLERVGREMMERYEAPAPPIYPEHFAEESQLGRYRDDEFRVEMNGDLLKEADPRPALETYLHEYRHAAQAYEIERSHGPLADGDPVRALELERSADNYVQPETDYSRYQEQLVERDARAFGEEWSDRILDARKHEEANNV